MAHILVIDDEVNIRFLIRTVLESAGHNIFEAQDGQVALDILETYPYPFDIIILDLRMPRMNGAEFLSALRNKSSYPPIVVLTAHGEPLPKALEDKVSGHLIKPFDTREFIDMVDSLLNVPTDLQLP